MQSRIIEVPDIAVAHQVWPNRAVRTDDAKRCVIKTDSVDITVQRHIEIIPNPHQASSHALRLRFTPLQQNAGRQRPHLTALGTRQAVEPPSPTPGKVEVGVGHRLQPVDRDTGLPRCCGKVRQLDPVAWRWPLEQRWRQVTRNGRRCQFRRLQVYQRQQGVVQHIDHRLDSLVEMRAGQALHIVDQAAHADVKPGNRGERPR